jgi:predicted  nucleic acid-binding Zn-ribbon protein
VSIDPAILATARRVSHLAGPHAHLLRAVIAELDDTRRHLLDARVELDDGRAEMRRLESVALETVRQATLAVQP